jgi:hypothetical protein
MPTPPLAAVALAGVLRGLLVTSRGGAELGRQTFEDDGHPSPSRSSNHVLKEEAAAAGPQESYGEPSRPLGHGVDAAVRAGVAR